MNERQRYESAECRNYVIISHLTTTIFWDKFSWKQQIKFVRNPPWPWMKPQPQPSIRMMRTLNKSRRLQLASWENLPLRCWKLFLCKTTQKYLARVTLDNKERAFVHSLQIFPNFATIFSEKKCWTIQRSSSCYRNSVRPAIATFRSVCRSKYSDHQLFRVVWRHQRLCRSDFKRVF